jgi:hypothetical protein
MTITVTFQPDATTGKDTYIDEQAATTNYATADLVYNNYTDAGNLTTFLLIDFTEILNLPRKLKVISAKLELYCTDNVQLAMNSQWFEILRDWVESEATWNVWKTGNNWTTAGAQGAGTDVNKTSRICSYDYYSLAASTWYAWYLDSYSIELRRKGEIFGWKFGDGAYGVGTDANHAGILSSSDNATAANRPKLTIVYEPYHKIFQMNAGAILGAK